MTNEELYMPYAYIKLMPGADKGNVLLYIRNMLNELSPSCLPDFEFCDTFSRHLYEKEIQFGDRVILSSVLWLRSFLNEFSMACFVTCDKGITCFRRIKN